MSSPFSVLRKAFRSSISSEFDAYLKDTVSESKLDPDAPDRQHFALYQDLHFTFSRAVNRMLFRLLTNHSRSPSHLFKLGIIADPTCELCQSSDGTVEHIFLHCPAVLSPNDRDRQFLLSKVSVSGWKNYFVDLDCNRLFVLNRIILKLLNKGIWI